MFTPPPSPLPRPHDLIAPLDAVESSDDIPLSPTTKELGPLSSRSVTMIADAKAHRSRRWRWRWAVLLVPAVLVLITISTRYVSHPAILDTFVNPSSAWTASLADWSAHRPHKRSPLPVPDPLPDPQAFPTTNPLAAPTTSGNSNSSSSPSSQPSPTVTADQTSQTIPPAPSAPPVLPTPFPQPWDTTFSQNFSTQGCKTFFTNMTQTEAFRTCRPFSLLQQSSSAFITAQTNLTALNNIIWGTCNTTPTLDQCVANMAWFANELQSACKADLSNRFTLVTTALTGLQAYSIMRTASCTINQRTSTYCYVDAVHNANPSDLYYYLLPLGANVPNTTKPSCSACTKSVLAVYEQGEQDGLQALKETYPSAAELAKKSCGVEYVQVGAGVSVRGSVWWGVIAVVVVTGFLGLS